MVGLLMANLAVAAPDLSSPKAAYRSYQQALTNGDIESLKAAVIADEKRLSLLNGQVAYTAAEKRFRDAVIKAFPAAEKDLPDPAKAVLAAIEKAEIITEGDHALLRTGSEDTAVEFRRSNGAWKLDLNTLYTDDDVTNVKKFREAVAEVMEAMLPDITAGKFSTYDQVTQALQSRVLMRAALPQEEATTKPAATTPAER
jgi:hypothetical protein